MITIKTASWFTKLPDDHVKIGISRGVPRFGKIGKGYRRYTKLNPGPWFNIPGNEQFTGRYYEEILNPLDPQRVHDEIMALADGRVPVLVCWERVGGPVWCHRSLAASWLAAGLGIAVPEFGFERLPADQHPLRQPARGATLLL